MGELANIDFGMGKGANNGPIFGSNNDDKLVGNKTGEKVQMETRNKMLAFSILCFTAAFLVYSYVVFAAEITIVGEVNDTFQIVANNTIYDVAETPMGDDLVKNYIAEKVQVTGTVEEKDDMKIITVKSFKIVPE